MNIKILQSALNDIFDILNSLDKLTDEDWNGIRNMIKSANDSDKAKRSV